MLINSIITEIILLLLLNQEVWWQHQKNYNKKPSYDDNKTTD